MPMLLPDELRDMRHVYEHPAEDDKTAGHGRMRAWMDGNLKAFLEYKKKLEGEWRERLQSHEERRAKRKERSGSEGSGAVALELLEKLLESRGWEVGR